VTLYSLKCDGLFQVVHTENVEAEPDKGGNVDQDKKDEDRHDKAHTVKTDSDAVDIEIASPGSYVSPFSIWLILMIGVMDNRKKAITTVRLAHQMSIYNFSAASVCTHQPTSSPSFTSPTPLV
jgi:hypothetical protein